MIAMTSKKTDSLPRQSTIHADSKIRLERPGYNRLDSRIGSWQQFNAAMAVLVDAGDYFSVQAWPVLGL